MKQPKKPVVVELAPLFERATARGQAALMQAYYDLTGERLDIPEPKQKPYPVDENEFPYAKFMSQARLRDD